MLKFLFKKSSLNKLTLAFSLFFSIAFISLPTFYSIENSSSQELFTDYENEKNNKEIDNENELDEYINESLVLSDPKIALHIIASKSQVNFKSLFLDIDSPPPDLI